MAKKKAKRAPRKASPSEPRTFPPEKRAAWRDVQRQASETANSTTALAMRLGALEAIVEELIGK